MDEITVIKDIVVACQGNLFVLKDKPVKRRRHEKCTTGIWP